MYQIDSLNKISEGKVYDIISLENTKLLVVGDRHTAHIPAS